MDNSTEPATRVEPAQRKMSDVNRVENRNDNTMREEGDLLAAGDHQASRSRYNASPTPSLRTTSSNSNTRTPSASPTQTRRRFPSARSSPNSPSFALPNVDVIGSVITAGGTYLGIRFDGSLGAGWNPNELARQLKNALGKNVKERELIDIFSDKTYQQIRSIEAAFDSRYERSLSERINSEKSLRGNLLLYLNGILNGPLNWDVDLVRKALGGLTPNDDLLIDLVISRSPFSLVLLRTAFAHRPNSTLSSKDISLDDAILSQYTTNVRLKTAWETALAGRWEDVAEEIENEEARLKLLRDDVDQLRVTLRRGGDHDIAIKILLARSPVHIHAIAEEYDTRSSSNDKSVAKAIESCFDGTLQKILLHVVRGAKEDDSDWGVVRDAERLARAVDSAASKPDLLIIRLVRLHWNRPRFFRVQLAFQSKYSMSLIDKVSTTTSGLILDALIGVILSAKLVETIPTTTDIDFDTLPSLHVQSASSESNPVPDMADFALDSGSLSPYLGSPIAEQEFPSEFERSTSISDGTLSVSSSMSSVDLMNEQMDDVMEFSLPASTSTSSLTFRQRSAPLESIERVPSSAPFAPRVRPPSSLRSRPSAPGRARRSSTESSLHDFNHASPLSPPLQPLSSPLFDNGMITPSTSMTSLAFSSPPSALSPRSQIDDTSYHTRPISPLGDIGSHSPSVGPFGPTTPLIFLPPLEERTPASSPEGNFESIFKQREPSNSSNSSDSESRVGTYDSRGSPEMVRQRSWNGGETSRELVKRSEELKRKLTATEARLEQSEKDYEQQHDELETRLEEAKSELQIKRREEKELRHSEKQHLEQINSLEIDVAKVERSLEKSRESYTALKNNYDEECSEAASLRGLLAAARGENQVAEDAIQHHLVQGEQYELDLTTAQATINKLEAEIAVMLRAQDLLDDQKQENLVLSETIERLHVDLDELRNRKSGFLDHHLSRSKQGSSSTGSVTKTLGRELEQIFGDREHGSAGTDEGVDEGIDEGIDEEDAVGTISVDNYQGHQPIDPALVLATTVSDAHTQTDTVATTDTEVQTSLADNKVDNAEEEMPRTKESIQKELAEGLGLDWDLLTSFIEGQKRSAVASKPSTSKAAKWASSETTTSSTAAVTLRSRRHWSSRFSTRLPLTSVVQAPAYIIDVLPGSNPFVTSVVASSATIVLYTMVIYMSGMITGSILMPTHHHHHLAPYSVMVGISDAALWNQYNTLGSAWGEGLANVASAGGIRHSIQSWISEIVWGGVNVIRKVPV